MRFGFIWRKCKSENAVGLSKMEHIDGLFIGRSAWQADNFNKIIRDVLK